MFSDITIRCDNCDLTFVFHVSTLEEAEEQFVEKITGRKGTEGNHLCRGCAWRIDKNYFIIRIGEDKDAIGLVYDPPGLANVVFLTPTRVPVFAERISKDYFESLEEFKIPLLQVEEVFQNNSRATMPIRDDEDSENMYKTQCVLVDSNSEPERLLDLRQVIEEFYSGQMRIEPKEAHSVPKPEDEYEDEYMDG